MKLFTMGALMACIMSFSPNLVLATESTAPAESLSSQEILHGDESKYATQFKEITEQINLLKSQYKGINQATRQLKEAGASYQHTLTADTHKVSQYLTDDQLGTMAGVYTIDAGYAALFLRKKELKNVILARRDLMIKLGFQAPLSPKMKKLLQNPESIKDGQAWTDAVKAVHKKFMANGINSAKQLKVITNVGYGMLVEGLYIATESIAMADYSPKMLEQLNIQHERIHFMIKLLNTMRHDEDLKHAVGFRHSLDFMGKIHALLIVTEYTRQDVEALREVIRPERQAILDGAIGNVATKQ
ncbi:hypothetical protein [Desulfoluna sp.]|uniref:hypothetical protein n=1 Tax=Desulfoluna sp. TaxID=2045199 RepID=UPI00260CC148|nr:hypothetical protein [Desulfoluna sp.]